MKKSSLLLTFVTCASSLFAQLQVDSSLIINDTLTVQDDARVGHNLEVEENARIKHDLEVDGATEVEDLVINGTTWMPNVPPMNSDNFNILVTKSDGTVMKLDGPGALFPVPYDPIGICDLQGGYSDSPYWISQPKTLYALCSDTKVGIRTDSPTQALDVRGTGFFQSGLAVGNPLFTPTTPAYFEGYGSANSQRPWIRCTVEENGTEETTFLVNNEGGIYCTSVRVRLQSDIPVPDYVFSNSYELMPLNEVKKFVKAESHLPNIPSEKELREEGIPIEEMQLKLLEKIEELTLYVIQLDEENKELKKEVNKLKNDEE